MTRVPQEEQVVVPNWEGGRCGNTLSQSIGKGPWGTDQGMEHSMSGEGWAKAG